MVRVLDVYLYNKFSGKLFQEDNGSLFFKYDKSYMTSEASKPLSVSLPFQDEKYNDIKTRPYFSGLLPEDQVLSKLASYLGLSKKNPFALLEAIGGECAGAVSLYNEGIKPALSDQQEYEILDDKDLKEVLNIIKQRPMLVGEKDVRLSLAGAQNKIAVGLINNKIAIMKGTTPTSHILKPIIQGIDDSVYNELFCMRLAKSVGFNVPDTLVRKVGGQEFLLEERYDREFKDKGKVIRLHQEDFCQALSIPPEMKYEREGGPNVKACLSLIEENNLQPAVDKLSFIRILIFNYLIGNADAHGKNYSLLHDKSKTRLAPFYDLLSTAVYPELSSKMAMKIGSKYDPNLVMLHHWATIAGETYIAKNLIEKDLKRLSVEVPEKAFCLKDNLKEEGITSDVFDRICKIIEQRTKLINNYF